MALIQTDDYRLMRDTDTRALLPTDSRELLRSRHSRSRDKLIKTHQEQADERFVAINQRIDRCELLLQELIQHMSMLVDKHPMTSESRD